MAHVAAVVVHHHHEDGHEADDGEMGTDEDMLEQLGVSRPVDKKLTRELDGDGDGVVNGQEMKAAFPQVMVRADHLLIRMQTEENIKVMIAQLPLFFICMATFIMGLFEFSPAANIGDIHRHIRAHFDSDSIGDIVDYDGIYEYTLAFAQANSELQATSTKYWCEERYWQYVWDGDIGIPRRTCTSPRQYALSLNTDESWSWVSVNEGDGSSTSSHRRLGASTGSASDANENSTCEDNNAALQEELNDSNLSCAGYTHACEVELGIKYCPKFCGFCSPWKYKHAHRFPMTQVTTLPVMIYQTRFTAADCHGFATTYENQPSNPRLWQLPPLDGSRNGPLLYCVNRLSQQEEEYAMQLDCPDEAPSGACAGGKFSVTRKSSFHGVTIYPKLLAEPQHNIDQLQALEWLDAQTESVTLSTLVYTEGVEVFTSVAVTFTLTEAGNIDASFGLVSYKDVVHDSRTTFIASLVATAVGAFIALLQSVRRLCKDWSECKLGFTLYEMISRIVMMVFAIYLLVSWSQQKPMSQEYDDLLHTFLDMPGSEPSDWEVMIDHFFEVKSHIYMETSWAKAQRITAYVVLYFQFVQLILYMSAHPKMGVLTETLSQAVVHLIHFLMLSGTLFLMLAFMAHWMLGEQIPDFATFQSTMRSQVQMLFGEFILIDGATGLSEGYTAMYWVYAGTFGIVMFFTLLNFFLAIIVDAFIDVKERIGTHVILASLFTDLVRVFNLWCKWKWHRWPPHALFRAYFKKVVKEQLESGSFVSQLQAEDDDAEKRRTKALVSPDEILKSIEDLKEDQLAEIIAYYFALSPLILCKRKTDDPEEEPPNPTASQQSPPVSSLNMPAGDTTSSVGAAMQETNPRSARSDRSVRSNRSSSRWRRS